MKIFAVTKSGEKGTSSDIEEEKNEVSLASASSKQTKKVIRKEKVKRSAYVSIKETQRIQLLIAKVELGLTVLEASKLLGIPYTNAKGICREFIYEQKVLTNSQMKKLHKSEKQAFKIDQSEFARLRNEILDKLEQFVADGTFSDQVVKRIQKSSVDVILRLSHAESYLDRFHDIAGTPMNVMHGSGKTQLQSATLPIPHTFMHSMHELQQPWYPDSELLQIDLGQNSERPKVGKSAKEIATNELHKFLFGQQQGPQIMSGNSAIFNAVCSSTTQ